MKYIASTVIALVIVCQAPAQTAIERIEALERSTAEMKALSQKVDNLDKKIDALAAKVDALTQASGPPPIPPSAPKKGTMPNGTPTCPGCLCGCQLSGDCTCLTMGGKDKAKSEGWLYSYDGGQTWSPARRPGYGDGVPADSGYTYPGAYGPTAYYDYSSGGCSSGSCGVGASAGSCAGGSCGSSGRVGLFGRRR